MDTFHPFVTENQIIFLHFLLSVRFFPSQCQVQKRFSPHQYRKAKFGNETFFTKQSPTVFFCRVINPSHPYAHDHAELLVEYVALDFLLFYFRGCGFLAACFVRSPALLALSFACASRSGRDRTLWVCSLSTQHTHTHTLCCLVFTKT